MMIMGNANGTAVQRENGSMQAGHTMMNMQTDAVSKNIQNQIAKIQKQMQELSSNETMTPEEKMKKRQELQQQINDLNMQLRQHQIERRKEEQQAKDSSAEETRSTAKAEKAGGKGTGLSQTGMTAMISADSSVKLAKVQGSVATKMEGKAGVLKAEINLDASRGGDTSAKKAALADVEQKAQAATSAQLSTLADAGRTLEEAAKTEQEDKKSEAAVGTEGKQAEAAAGTEGKQAEAAAGTEGKRSEAAAGTQGKQAEAAVGTEGKRTEAAAGTEGKRTEAAVGTEGKQAEAAVGAERKEAEADSDGQGPKKASGNIAEPAGIGTNVDVRL